MPAHNVPLSLEQLLAKKRKEKNIEPRHETSIGRKTRFLTKSQREKIEKEKIKVSITKVPHNNVRLALKNMVDKSKMITEQNKDFENNQTGNEMKRPKTFSNKFKFDWDESDDTSKNDIPLLVRDRRNNTGIDSVHRKSRKDDMYDGVHWSKKALNTMCDRDWRIVMEDFDISIKGKTHTHILRSWSDGEIPEPIIKQLKHLHFQDPTPIQRAAIPLVLANQDVVGLAETGSGKTLAYTIPALSYIMNLPPVRPFESPYVLIVVPTRELAQQIEKEFYKFTNISFNVASIIGGQTYQSNIDKLEKGVEILIGTPGRLIDIIEKKIVTLDRCFFLVADEADIIIDMGFQAQFQALIDELPPGENNIFSNELQDKKRISLMFTATMNKAVEKIVSQYLINPVTITVGNINEGVDSVVQEAIKVTDNDDSKMSVLKNILLSKKYAPPIIIFVNYRKYCDILYDFLKDLKFNPTQIHGAMSQEMREESILKIKTRKSDILIATDVAGRGIDIPNVSVVINYHMSNSISAYIHRIGRTGRAGKKGTAITFWNIDTDADVLPDLKNVIMKSQISNCPNDLLYCDPIKKSVVKNIDT